MSDLEGHEESLIVVNNWVNPEVDKLCQQLASKGAEVWKCTYNLGLGASWNLGMRRMMDDGDAFVIILSASAVFTKPLQHFIDAIINHETKEPVGRYVASGRATLHCFAHTRLGVEVGGYFDENFWPIYYEDTDFCHRSKYNGLGTRPDGIADRSSINTGGGSLVKPLGLEDVVHSHSYSAACNSDKELMLLHQLNTNRWTNYYVRKWGGQHGSERYIHPFNDPTVGINEWSVIEPFHHPRFAYPWNPPPPSTRYSP
jgi:hypothetical protein